MNSTIQELFNRKSVRMFSDEPITKEERELILKAALQAPTAGNMALYSIIDVQDQALKDLLAKRCDNQPFIAKAPLVFMFLADYQKWFDLFEAYDLNVPPLCEADLFLASQDCIIAAQNAVVAAESLGIGSCYIGDILENFEENKKTFNLSKYAVPMILLVLGKPTTQQKERIKPQRFDLDDMVHINTYHHKSIEETKEMIKKPYKRDDKQLEDFVTRLANMKFLSEFRQEMNRSVKAIIDSWSQK